MKAHKEISCGRQNAVCAAHITHARSNVCYMSNYVPVLKHSLQRKTPQHMFQLQLPYKAYLKQECRHCDKKLARSRAYSVFHMVVVLA